MRTEKTKRKGLSASFATGAVALVFLVIGYQAALFIHRAATSRAAAAHERPDTVFVMDRSLAESILRPDTEIPKEGPVVVRKAAPHSTVRPRQEDRSAPVHRPAPESFPFDPNTVSAEELRRLGFSARQAEAIVHYREKGGRFHRSADFAKSYVVADTVYQRLAPYIRIPKIDINQADSAALVTLPGIGPYFAGRILAYRTSLGGFSYPQQLMDLYRFDQEKYDALADLITCSAPQPYPLWALPEDTLRQHPYIRSAAHGVVLYRTHQPKEAWTVAGLRQAGVLNEEQADRLSRCSIAKP